jgi:hypothetical protein
MCLEFYFCFRGPSDIFFEVFEKGVAGDEG